MLQFLTFALLFAKAFAAPILRTSRSITPSVNNVRVIGNVTDPLVSRDSCTSTRIDGRAFWTCRDTQQYNAQTGQALTTVNTNSASWSTSLMFGPEIQMATKLGAGSTGNNALLAMYGGDASSQTPYYPVLSDECPSTGFCSDGTRWAVWPDTAPMIASTAYDGTTIAYTWIPRSHLSGLTLLNSPVSYTLYKTIYTTSDNSNALPTVSVVDEQFWAAGEIGYGDYGNVVKDGNAYLYGQTSSRTTALARVKTSEIENKSAYEYYVNGAWTTTKPAMHDAGIAIANAGAGGQGTFYWSAYFNAYVWIGGTEFPGADFFITTAPSPEGPWTATKKIYSGESGNYNGIGAYSCVAHPALLPSDDASENGIYLTWTQQWNTTTYGAYTTPLVYVTFD